jgi:hypothetical protein
VISENPRDELATEQVPEGAEALSRRSFLTAAAGVSLAFAGGAGPAFAALKAEKFVIGIGLPFRTSIVYKPLLAGFKRVRRKPAASFCRAPRSTMSKIS